MNKKVIRRYILLCVPFCCGFILITMGIYNIVSALLFFVGGYIIAKNIGDYRIIRRNIKKCSNDSSKKIDIINSDRENDRKIVNSYNSLGYRDSVNNDMDECKYWYKCKNADSINGIKNTRRKYVKVRRKY